jgi:hypothetical protein
MQDQVNAAPTPHRRLPWNKGKLTGAKPPLRPKHVRGDDAVDGVIHRTLHAGCRAPIDVG